MSLTVGSACPVGNKNDDPDRKVVLTADAQTFAQQMGIQLFETSAKENINVEEVMRMRTMMSTFIAHDSINSALSVLRSVRRGKGIIVIDCVYILYRYSLPSNRLTAFMSHVTLNRSVLLADSAANAEQKAANTTARKAQCYSPRTETRV